MYKEWYHKWQKKTKIQILKRIERERSYNIVADRFAEKYIPKRCIAIWKEFVKSQKDQRWREFRKDILRKSVKVYLITLNKQVNAVKFKV